MDNQNMSQEDLEQYQGNYSEEKFWSKLAKYAKKAGGKVVYYALLLFYVLKSENVGVREKAMIIGALGYLILPIDLIPDFIPVLGFTDDLTAILIAYNAIKGNVTPEIDIQARAKMAQWFGSDFHIE